MNDNAQLQKENQELKSQLIKTNDELYFTRPEIAWSHQNTEN